jgi:hypothetical protein
MATLSSSLQNGRRHDPHAAGASLARWMPAPGSTVGDFVRVLEVVRVGVLAAMLGIVAISAAVVVTSINEGDSGSAWVWAAVFLLASFEATWFFWRML